MTIQSTTIKYPSKMPSAIFLDSGGVINDNTKRAPQWFQYLGEYLPTTVLGGTAQVWGQVNAAIMRPFFSRWYEYMAQAIELAAQAQAKAIEEGKDRKLIESGQDKATNVSWIFERLHLLIWIKDMCRVAGPYVPELESKVVTSLSDEDLLQIARSAHLYAIQRVKADYPGAVDAIRKLSAERTAHAKPYKLCTSSADTYEDMEYILNGLGVLECFDDVFGSDRVNCLKTSSEYFERVFARVGVRPVSRDSSSGEVLEGEEGKDEIVVLDDNVKALKWARVLGARTVLVTSGEEVDLSSEGHGHIDYQIKTLAELPALLESWRVHLEGK